MESFFKIIHSPHENGPQGVTDLNGIFSKALDFLSQPIFHPPCTTCGPPNRASLCPSIFLEHNLISSKLDPIFDPLLFPNFTSFSVCFNLSF